MPVLLRTITIFPHRIEFFQVFACFFMREHTKVMVALCSHNRHGNRNISDAGQFAGKKCVRRIHNKRMFEAKLWCVKHIMRKKSGLDSGHDYLQKPAIHKVVFTQFGVTLFLTLLSLPVSFNTALSALSGGLCCSIPHAYLVWKTFRYRGASAAHQIINSFYQGEIGKFVLTIAAFVLVFTLHKSIEPWVLFGTFFIVQSTNWLTPLLLTQRQRKNSH